MFPDAFRFQVASADCKLVMLQFMPNPNLGPLSRPAQVFHHLEGTLAVDAAQKRIAEINGRLTTDVKFAGGLLGHLDSGGTFTVKEQDMGSGHWEMVLMDVEMNGKALFFKTIA